MQEVKSKKEKITIEEVLKLFSGNLDSIFWKLDENLNFSYISPNIKNILDFDETGLMHKPFTELLFDDFNKKTILSELNAIQFSSQQMVQTSGCLINRDGKPIYTEIIFINDSQNTKANTIIGCFKNISSSSTSTSLLLSKIKVEALSKIQTHSIFILDFNGYFIYANDKAKKLFSLNYSAISQHNVTELFNDNTLAVKFINESKEIAKSNKGDEKELTFYDKAKIAHKLNLLRFPVNVDDQTLIMVVAVELKSLQNVIASESEFNKALNSINHLIWIYNVDNGEFKYSKNFIKSIGYTEKEIQHTIDFLIQSIHPEQQVAVFKMLNDHIIGKTDEFKTECRIKSKTGKWKWFLCQGKLISDLDNNKKVIGTFIDITDSKKAVKQLKTSEARNKAFLKLIPDMIFVFNRDGIFVDAYVHDAHALFAPPDHFLGKTVFDVFPYDKAHKFSELQTKAFETKEVQVLEFPLEIKNENKFFEIRVVYIDANHVLAIIRDITFRKESEDSLKKSEFELKKLNETKDKLLSIIAHDLKTPFNNIMGFTDLLIEGLTDYETKKIEEYLYYINTSARQAHNLLENLLEWARSQSSKIVIQPDKFDMKKIIERNIHLLSGNIKQKNIDIENLVPDNTVIYADAVMISTVIRNLLSNAIKFSYPSGKIQICSDTSNSLLNIYVKDYGIGMSKDILNKLFMVNENISRKGTSGEKGTGLGLLLCKDFIEKNNATLSVQSETSKGTTFTLSFPLV